jgi:hypothetical protein
VEADVVVVAADPFQLGGHDVGVVDGHQLGVLGF